ncbi:MAG: hypothetical protein H3C51_10865 [Rubellimicrobium sp.]|nr:hypothetical protein [Rubellimicrobium sp.]
MAAVVVPLAVAGPALAQDTFQLPEGCTAYVTEQQRSCIVSHHFTCTDDPAGWQRRVDIDESGVIYIGAIDAETRWVESLSPQSGIVEVLGDDERDPASFSTLTSTGIDTFDFTTRTDPDGIVTRFTGQDRLTGETVTISGVILERTEFSMIARDENGAEVWRAEGREFINRDWRTFFGGTRTTTMGDESWDADTSPMAFIFPGEPGFLSASPRYDCGALLSKAPVPGARE